MEFLDVLVGGSDLLFLRIIFCIASGKQYEVYRIPYNLY